MRLRAEQVATEVGCSIATLNNWYRFKRENPEHPLSKKIPAYKKEGSTGPRYWTKADVNKLIKFKETRVRGRYGEMASVTQRYVKKEGE